MYLKKGWAPADADPSTPADSDPIPPEYRLPQMQTILLIDADNPPPGYRPPPPNSNPSPQIQTMLGSQSPFPVYAGLSNGNLTIFP